MSSSTQPTVVLVHGAFADASGFGMWATQRPLSIAALTENATAAGWKTKPSWYLVSGAILDESNHWT